jgi:hypothetical protein
MGGTSSKSIKISSGNNVGCETRFDQVGWCEHHGQFVDRSNIVATQRYIRWRHPWFGAATAKPPIWTGTETLAQLATFADALTILCCQAITENDDFWQSIVANCAFIALHHKNQRIALAAKHHIVLHQQHTRLQKTRLTKSWHSDPSRQPKQSARHPFRKHRDDPMIQNDNDNDNDDDEDAII